MVSLKSLSSSLSNKDKDNNNNDTVEPSPTSSSSNASLSDWTDADPRTSPASVTSRDMATDSSSSDKATYVLSTDTEQGKAVVGTASADPNHPQANPVSSPTGEPVTALPHTAKDNLTSVVTSGQQGLGPHGAATKDAITSSPVEGSGKEAVVGPAKGMAPEVVATTRQAQDKKEKEKEKDDVPWFKKLKIGRDSSSSSVSQQAEDGKVDEGLTAMNKVAPETVTGADLSNVDPKKEVAHPVGENVVTDKDGKPIPTKLSATARGLEGNSVSPSIKDKISTIHDTDPNTTNEHFHELFPDLPPEDELIEDYRCALQREILVQGHIYISEHHLSFRANIFGWETTITLPWTEITTIEKKMTALVIPNGIEVTSIHTTHNFASLLMRDATYDLMVTLWRHAHPEAREEKKNADESVTVDPKRIAADNQSEVSYTGDDGQKKKYQFKKPKLPSVFKHVGSVKSGKGDKGMTEAEKVKAAAQGGHAPTSYDGDEYDKVALDVVLPTSPEKAAELFFKDVEFLRPFLEDKENLKEVDIGEWNKEGDVEKREMHYIKPLNGSVGPKQTLCNISDEEEHNDPEEYITVVTTTKTPDVPSGNDFCVKTRTVFTWSETGGCQVKVTTEVEWTKVNRMLKGIIERSCLSGQKSYHEDLESAVREHIAANKDEYAVAGASDEAPQSKSKDEDGGILSTLTSFVPDPTVALIVVVVVLLFSNFWTLIALRHQAKAAHAARLGNPGEVANAVSRVLSKFNDVHAKRSSGGGDAMREVQELGKVVKGLEKQLAVVGDRIAGLAAQL